MNDRMRQLIKAKIRQARWEAENSVMGFLRENNNWLSLVIVPKKCLEEYKTLFGERLDIWDDVEV